MGFEFKKKKKLTLDIAGSFFKVKLNAEFMEKVLETGKKLRAYGNDPAIVADTLEDQFAFACDCIDDILGDDAADKIFENAEEPDAFDAFDVLQYIVGEVTKADQNRARRRIAAKQNRPSDSKKQNRPSDGKKHRYKGNHH